MKFPKTTFGKKFPDSRLYDYMIYDQSTGFKIWKSEATKLGTYTGKGGMWVHNKVANDAYNIVYGLVPYKIPAELPIPETTSNHAEPGVPVHLVANNNSNPQDEIKIVALDGSNFRYRIIVG